MSKRQAELLLAAVILARSTSYSLSKMVLATMSVFNVLAARFGIAFCVLAVIFFARIRRAAAKDLLYGAAIGCAFFCVMTADMYALRTAPASTVSFLENTAIILVPLVQAVLLRCRPGKQELLPAGLALVGVACLTLRGGTGAVGAGELLAIVAALFYTAAILLTGRLSRRGDPLIIGVAQIGTIGALGLAASLLFETPRLPQTGREWVGILTLALVCSCLGFTFQPMAQRHLPAQRAAQFCAIGPLSASIQGAVFCHERLGVAGLAGAGLILAAMLLRSGETPEPKAAPAQRRPV